MLSHSRLVFSSLSPITVKGNVPADGGGGGTLRRQAGGFEFEANLITEQILGQPGVLHRETMSQITKSNKQTNKKVPYLKPFTSLLKQQHRPDFLSEP